MTIEVLDRLNRRFSGWHERLFGHLGHRELRPQDILRRITAEMDSARRKGLDGLTYVPNVYTLQVAVGSDDERQYLRTFLGAEELVNAVASEIEARGYRVKGTLLFTVEEVAPAVLEQRIRVLCRFDPHAAQSPAVPVSASAPVAFAPSNPVTVHREEEEEEEPGTVAAVGAQAVAQMMVAGSAGTPPYTVPVTLAGLKIGRSRREGNDIIIDNDPQVSKRHARIAYENGRFVLYDESSMNGTFLRGARITPGQPIAFNFGDEIKIGETQLVLQQITDSRQPFTKLAHSPVPQPAPVGNHITMPSPRVSTPSESGITYRLLAGDGTVYPLASEMTLGRGVTEDIVLIANGVSSRHARFTQRGVALYVEDLNTPTGTFVNGERIPANFPVALYNEDQISFGEALLRVERR